MQYQEKYFYLCSIPLSAEDYSDVKIVTRADTTEDFPRIFHQYEELRSHAFNEDNLYSVVRADVITIIVRTTTPAAAKELAFEESRANLITNLQHRVMQNDDKNAKQILRKVHQLDM